jgi:signal transduction histidine kinase
VRDHGAGIARDVLPRIFEPFFTTRDVGVGTGLGLSVAYGIMQDHGGFIEVDTEVGAGTTVSLYLPQ